MLKSVHSTMKLANAYDLIVSRCVNSRSKGHSSIAHLAMHPFASLLRIIVPRGNLVLITMLNPSK
jgi:hypothetical protein